MSYSQVTAPIFGKLLYPPGVVPVRGGPPGGCNNISHTFIAPLLIPLFHEMGELKFLKN
jgi:hypothetical protein